MYFPVWRDDWKKADQEKTDALKKVLGISSVSQKMMAALVRRQKVMAIQQTSLTHFPAKSTSPFVTGLGNEHPLENGFAFINPYGLPYLPGSSVKGVVRSAAEELALGVFGENHGWDMLAVWWLFGFEGGSSYLSSKAYNIDVLDEEAKRRRQAYRQWVEQSNYDSDCLGCFIAMTVTDKKKYQQDLREFLLHLPDDISNQGALQFWDVYPQNQKLSMDILTPHHGGYYKGENAPHDSEQPNPNVFLTIPSGSGFDFYCGCESAHLPISLQNNWQDLLLAAFQYAFDWLGFGAKTAVGYGQMQKDSNAANSFEREKDRLEQQMLENAKRMEEEERLKKMPPIEREITQVLKENKDPNKKEYLVLLEAVRKQKWQDPDRQHVLERIRGMMQDAGGWKETTKKRKPEKDKEYQLTLEIKRLLE